MEEFEKERSRNKKMLIFLSVIVFLAFAIFIGLRVTSEDAKVSVLSCTFFKVGKADAIILQSKGQTMVIDTGEEDDAEELTDFLKATNVTRIDVLIITHYDKDHVGGAAKLLNEIPASRVLVPAYTGANAETKAFLKALKANSITEEAITAPLSFTFADAQVMVDPPLSYEIKNENEEFDNNFSLVVTVTHGRNRLFFAGDIEEDRINELVSADKIQECGFLKVPHHGVFDPALESLLAKMKPQYAVICSSDKNPAETKTLELLKKYKVETFETRNGDITLTSDGLFLDLKQ